MPSSLYTLIENGYVFRTPQNGVDWVQEFSKMSVGIGLDQNQRTQDPVPQTHSIQNDLSKEETENISSALIEQMSRDPDPKFRNSKFLEFVKMLNSGELVIEGDRVERKEGFSAQTIPQEKPIWLDGSENWGMEAGGLEGGWLEDSEIEEWLQMHNELADGPIYQHRDYQFATDNPFFNNPNTLQIAKESFSQVTSSLAMGG